MERNHDDFLAITETDTVAAPEPHVLSSSLLAVFGDTWISSLSVQIILLALSADGPIHCLEADQIKLIFL